MRGYNPAKARCSICGQLFSTTGGAHERMHWRQGLMGRALATDCTYRYFPTTQGLKVQEERRRAAAAKELQPERAA